MVKRGLDVKNDLWEHTHSPGAHHRASFDVGFKKEPFNINSLSSVSRRRSQVVRQRSAKPLSVGSIPTAASNHLNHLQT